MSNYQINLTAIDYDLCDGEGNRFLDNATLLVSAVDVPYRAATHLDPPEGGYFDDIQIVKILEVLDENGEDITLEDVSLGARLWGYTTPSLLDILGEALEDALYTQNDNVQQQLAEEEEGAREAAEESHADWLRECRDEEEYQHHTDL